MNDTSTQTMNDADAANSAARRIVRHFQLQGFTRITEALIIQIRHIAGDRAEINEAFEAAQELDNVPPLKAYFEIYPYGHFSEFRSYAEAKNALKSDFTLTLINDVPKVFFDPAPVLVDDPLANGSKYDVMMKIRDNVDGHAVVILLNDPDASFIDYIGTHPGADWQKIMGGLDVATTSIADELDLF